MLHVGERRVGVCAGHGFSRRSFLQAGSAGVGGLTLPNMLALEANGAVDPAKAKIRNCITLFLVGAPGHLDTFDMKPEAPAQIRGKFRPIATNVPGMEICEHFPLLARRMDKVAMVRSLHHSSGTSHEDGHRWMMTGQHFRGPETKPYIGSVISRMFGPKGALPASIILPGKIGNTGAGGGYHGQTASFLGSGHEPFFLGSDPSRSKFKVSNLVPPKGQTDFRIDSRRNLLKQLDDLQRTVDTPISQRRETAYDRAFNLLTSPATKQAFDLNREENKLRDRYGRNTFGQSCLMARRLVESGCRHITVNHFDTVFGVACWDMHANGGSLNNTYAEYENLLCPQFDIAFTALLDDLEDRGLLEETVVAVVSEMGRTPKLNKRGGRDHYPQVWTNFLAGGSFQTGQVIGSSDKFGTEPKTRPVKPPEFVASVLHGMGIDLERTMLPGPGSRPVRLVEAEPMPELF
jgi:hypothetical protein